MEKKKGEATANSGPAASVVSRQEHSVAYSRNGTVSQDRSGAAPLHLLVDQRLCRCVRVNGSACQCVPVVVCRVKDGSTFVGIRNPVWGHGAKVREFLGAPKSAERYRLQLWEELRALAWAEFDRRERLGSCR